MVSCEGWIVPDAGTYTGPMVQWSILFKVCAVHLWLLPLGIPTLVDE